MHWTYRLAATGAGTAVVAAALFSGNTYAANVYSDVPPAHWAYTAVQWAAQYGIMVGPGGKPGFFDAAGVVNRAQLATVLARHNNILQKQITDLQSRVNLLEQRVGRLDGQTASRSSSSSSRGITAGTFMATLNAAQETTAVTSNGTGMGSFALNGNRLEYDITVSNLTTAITAAHFHTGAPGVAGPAIEPITFSGNRATGTWNMNANERADLLAGRIYVNVHTIRYPDGEVRGQVVPSSSSASSMSGRSSSGSSGRSSSFSSTSSNSSNSNSSSSSLSSASSNSSMSNSSFSASSLSSGASSSFSS